MGHPIKDDALDAKVRETRADGGSISGIAREFGIGVNRVRRILGLPLPPSQRPSGQKRYIRLSERKPDPTPPMKSITIPLTESAYERLAAIAATAYLSPEAFAATLVASYLSYQPDKIVLEPSEPEEPDPDEEPDEEPEEDVGEEPEEPEPPPKPAPKPSSKKPKAPPAPEPEAEPAPEPEAEPEPEDGEKPDYSYIKPGRNLVLVEGEEEQSLVWVSQILAKGGVVKGPGDKVRVKRKDGVLVDVLAAELDPVMDDD